MQEKINISVGQGLSLGHSMVPVCNLGLRTPWERVHDFHVPDWDIQSLSAHVADPGPHDYWSLPIGVQQASLPGPHGFSETSILGLELQSPQLGSTVPLQWWTTQIQMPSQNHWADQQFLGPVNSPSRALSNDQCLGPTSRILIWSSGMVLGTGIFFFKKKIKPSPCDSKVYPGSDDHWTSRLLKCQILGIRGGRRVVRSKGIGAKQSWVQVPEPLLPSWESLGESVHLLGLSVLISIMGITINTPLSFREELIWWCVGMKRYLAHSCIR